MPMQCDIMPIGPVYKVAQHLLKCPRDGLY